MDGVVPDKIGLGYLDLSDLGKLVILGDRLKFRTIPVDMDTSGDQITLDGAWQRTSSTSSCGHTKYQRMEKVPCSSVLLLKIVCIVNQHTTETINLDDF